jgi:hypothetical protein
MWKCIAAILPTQTRASAFAIAAVIIASVSSASAAG